jgi:flagellar biogenesis protein FliO
MNASDAARGGTSGMGKSSLFAALALVLGGTAGVLWLGKRGGRARRGRLPAEVFEQLGKASLSPKLEAYLLRVGGKLVLVGVHAGEANPLTEITDPVEVQRIIAACAAGGPAFVGNSLADVPATFASETGHSSFAASLRRSLAQLETRNA